jgi:hypothetical protein
MIGIVCSGIGDVIENLLSVQSIPLGNGEHSNWSKGTFRIDVQALSLTSAHTDRQLTPSVSYSVTPK